jgi:hypothetical protein
MGKGKNASIEKERKEKKAVKKGEPPRRIKEVSCGFTVTVDLRTGEVLHEADFPTIVRYYPK